MGIPTLISTATASNASEVAITSGVDSTYDEYMFVCTDINAATDNTDFGFQVNVDGQSGYNETMTTTVFDASIDGSGGSGNLAYNPANDQAQGTALQPLIRACGNGADESGVVILHLFSPSNTTYVTHFYARAHNLQFEDYSQEYYLAGYVNVTGAIDEIEFKMTSGNFDGVIQMYGIA